MENYKQFYGKRQSLGAINSALFVDSCNTRFIEVAKIVSGSVLDVGCGFGELKSFIACDIYTGIDGTQWAADIGGNECIDLFDYHVKHDWVVALGILETTLDINEAITKLKSLASVGVIVSYHTDAAKIFNTVNDEQIQSALPGCELIALNDHEKIAIFRNSTLDQPPKMRQV